ncbi:MAG TPA: sodium:solute symporter [Tepidisphaeraceae bacterium]|jgi:SSS family transporter
MPMMLAVFGPYDWAVLVAYFALVTVVGVAVARKEQNADEYFLGHRSIPAWAAALSLVATMLSAATFVGVPDAAFATDISYLSLSIGGIIAVFIVGLIFVPRLYHAGSVTIYGFIGQRYGDNARMAISCMFILGRLLASGSRLFMAALPVCLLMFGAKQPSLEQLILSICLITAVGTFYTTIGGVRAVVWVDVIQLIIVIGTAFLSIWLLLHRIPLHFGQIFQLLAHSNSKGHDTSKLHLLGFSFDPTLNYTFWTAIIGGTFLNTATYGVDQDLAQRFLVTRSAWRGSISVISAQLISIVVICLFLFIGLLLYIFYQRPEVMHANHGTPANGISIYPWFLLNELPTVFSGISIAGFFAIAQGSMDSAMNALASSIVADIWLPLRARRNPQAPAQTQQHASKFIVAAVGVLLCAFAIFCAIIYNPEKKTLLDFALGVMTFAFSGMLGVFLAALLTRRGNGASVIVALLMGVLMVTLLQDRIMQWWTGHLFGSPHTLAWPWWMPIGTTASFICCVLGSPKRRDV